MVAHSVLNIEVSQSDSPGARSMDLLARRASNDTEVQAVSLARKSERLTVQTGAADLVRSEPGHLQAQLNMLLVSGGDERIWPDAVTGSSKYGTTPTPAPNEIFFSSSTASTISPRGYAAAGRVLAAILDQDRATRLDLEDWFDGLRARLLALYGIDGAQAVLAGSGTETELLALAFGRGSTVRPLVNIVVAPDETGSGVRFAAAGQHFLATTSLQGDVVARTRLAGWEEADIRVEAIEIRKPNGDLRPSVDVDLDAAQIAMRALHNGSDVLLHVLDSSKTGVAGVSREAAARIAAAAPGRVTVLVDACQMRCAPARVQSDLHQGFLVMVTGSKFAGGPPFAGALLLPGALMPRFAAGANLPRGLGAYSAALDWPARLRERFTGVFTSPANLGLGLRWEAALAELETLATIPLSLQGAIFTSFAHEVVERVNARPWLRILDGNHPRLPDGRPRTILPLVMVDHPTPEAAGIIHRKLRAPVTPGDGLANCHVGQPVSLGGAAALRLCASAPMANLVAERMSAGYSLRGAMAPVREDLDRLFAKWSLIRDRIFKSSDISSVQEFN